MGVTDYRLGFDPAVPGSPASAVNSNVVRSKFNASTEVLAWGRAVVQGTKNDDVIMPASNKTDFVGVVARTYMYETVATSDGSFGYPPKKQIDVVTQGDIWVAVEEAVNPGDKVFFRIAPSTTDTDLIALGKFRTDADTTPAVLDDTNTGGVDESAAAVDTAVEVKNARWIKSGTNVACLSLNLA